MKKIALLIFLSVFALIFNCSEAKATDKEDFLVAGYLNSNWIKPTTDLEFIDYLDRIFFFGLSPDKNGVFTVSDKYISNYQMIRSKVRKDQKILLVVGGGGLVANMHVMGNDEVKREAFIKELVAFATKYKFDGIDIDWETDWKAKPEKMVVPVDNLIAMITSIKEQMPSHMTITAALGGGDVKHASAIKDEVEDISLMLYSTLNKEGLHTPLYTVIDRLSRYEKINFPKDKLLVGVPFYGKAENKKVMVYRDIVTHLDAGDTSTHIYDGYSFNSVDVMKDKVKYLKENGYRGIMIWELTQDAPYSHPMSLLRAIYTEAKSK